MAEGRVTEERSESLCFSPIKIPYLDGGSAGQCTVRVSMKNEDMSGGAHTDFLMVRGTLNLYDI